MALAQAVPAPIGVAVMASRPVAVVAKSGPAPRIGISAARPAGTTGPITPAPVAPAPEAPEAPAEPVLVSAPPAAPAAPAPEKMKLVANFENGLDGWSTAPAGNIPPRVVRGVVRDGSSASVFRLTGEQSRSLLIVGGDSGSEGAVQIHEGDEYTFSFSFYVQSMVYGEPGADNVARPVHERRQRHPHPRPPALAGPGMADPLNSGRGLWASGDAMGGDRFLAPFSERTWHDVVIQLQGLERRRRASTASPSTASWSTRATGSA